MLPYITHFFKNAAQKLMAFTIIVTVSFALRSEAGLTAESDTENISVRYPGAYGDPHFTGFDGINFDFTGEAGGTYCMLSDTELHINMELVGDGTPANPNPNRASELPSTSTDTISVFDPSTAGFVTKRARSRTWIKAIGILYRGHRIEIEAESGDLAGKTRLMKKVTFDGVDATAQLRSAGDAVVRGAAEVKYETESGASGHQLPCETKSLVSGQQQPCDSDSGLSGQQLPYETYIVRLGDDITLSIKVSPEIPEERVPGVDAFLHLSVDFISGARQHLSGAVHGILGQTLLNARGRTRLRGTGTFKTTWNPLLMQQQVDGPNGDGYLDGSGPFDYATSGLLHSDCSFSRYNPNLVDDDRLHPVSNLAATVSSGYARRFLSGSLV